MRPRLCVCAHGIRFLRRGPRRPPPKPPPGPGAPAKPALEAARSQRHFFMSVRMAFDRHGDGERRDVTRERENVDAEGRRVAAIALWPDTEAIGLVEQLLLERVERRIGIG